MVTDKNRIIQGKHGKEILLDIYYSNNGRKKPVVLFAHGFKGFKDWGHFNRIASHFANKGFVFIKFNFSHNGTTTDKPTEFADLEAFAKNNYTIEQDDIDKVIEELLNGILLPTEEFDESDINLLGHSRGGAMAIVKASEDDRIKRVATWGAISFIGTRLDAKALRKWKKDGVTYFPNARTGQDMPMYYQILEDYETQKERYDVEKAAQRLKVPLLVVHGTKDETVPFAEAKILVSSAKNSKLIEIEGANHVLGGKHPFLKERLPQHTQIAVNATIEFLRG